MVFFVHFAIVVGIGSAIPAALLAFNRPARWESTMGRLQTMGRGMALAPRFARPPTPGTSVHFSRAPGGGRERTWSYRPREFAALLGFWSKAMAANTVKVIRLNRFGAKLELGRS